jgi:hypothetical protein
LWLSQPHQWQRNIHIHAADEMETFFHVEAPNLSFAGRRRTELHHRECRKSKKEEPPHFLFRSFCVVVRRAIRRLVTGLVRPAKSIELSKRLNRLKYKSQNRRPAAAGSDHEDSSDILRLKVLLAIEAVNTLSYSIPVEHHAFVPFLTE